jgi:urease accessory protein
MLHLRERINEKLVSGGMNQCEGLLTLSFEDRRKSRLRTRLDDGREVAVLLPRGTILRDGERLLDHEEHVTVEVKAAMERLSVARATDHHLLARAAYHLGNRHVPLQLGPDWVAYQHDHVLDRLVRELGLIVAVELKPFEPEAGGYGQSREHSYDHDHHEH